MATSRLKNWFTQVTATASALGSRFRTGDKPTQSTFEDLLASIPFKKEALDKAKEGSTTAELSTVVGLVQAATDEQVASRQAPLADRTLVVQPHQIPLPVSASATQVYVAVEGNDTTGTGSITAPFATIAKAITVNKNIYVFAGTYEIDANLASFGKTIYLESGVNITTTNDVTCLFTATTGFKLSGSGTINVTNKLLQTTVNSSVIDVQKVTIICSGEYLTTLALYSKINMSEVTVRTSAFDGITKFNSNSESFVIYYIYAQYCTFKGVTFKFNPSGNNDVICLFEYCSFYKVGAAYYSIEMGAYASASYYHVNLKNCTFDSANNGSAIALLSTYTSSSTNPTLSLLSCTFSRCDNSIVNLAVTKKYIAFTNLSATDVTADGLTTDFRNTGGGIGNVAKQINDSNVLIEEKPHLLYTYSLFSA